MPTMTDLPYRYTLPDGRNVNLVTITRQDLATLPTITDCAGNLLKVDTGSIRVWMQHGMQDYRLRAGDVVSIRDAIVMEELRGDKWEVTSIWQ